MAAGSSFWHGSHTYVGYSFDNNMISVIAYLAHQASVSNLPGNSSILKELSPTPRNASSVEVSEQITKMFSTQPVVEWSETLWTVDMPHDYFVIFGAIVGTIFTLSMPYIISNFILTKLITSLLNPTQQDFLMNNYLPELHEATKHLTTTQDEKTALLEKFTGCLIKLLYAFLF